MSIAMESCMWHVLVCQLYEYMCIFPDKPVSFGAKWCRCLFCAMFQAYKNAILLSVSLPVSLPYSSLVPSPQGLKSGRLLRQFDVCWMWTVHKCLHASTHATHTKYDMSMHMCTHTHTHTHACTHARTHTHTHTTPPPSHPPTSATLPPVT